MAENLPRDILKHIFSRLPIESVLQCKRVCTTWRKIIGNNVGFLVTFKELSHWGYYAARHYYGDCENALTSLIPADVNLQSQSMVGSCNGLVCYKTNSIYDIGFTLSNPITGEVASIPPSGYQWESSIPPVGGFGYVGSTNEYKVVRIIDRDWRSFPCVDVYTLGSQLGWRKKRFLHHSYLSSGASGVFANEALHWISENGIVAFGMADEEFRNIITPINICNNNCRNCKLIILGGNLCVVHTNHDCINKRLDIWALKRNVMDDNISTSYGQGRKDYYDDTWSWSKEYSIESEGEVMYTPFVITKRNTVLLWQNGTSNLCCYDPKTSTLQKYWDGDENDKVYVQAIPHMNSLVSLKDLGESSILHMNSLVSLKDFGESSIPPRGGRKRSFNLTQL